MEIETAHGPARAHRYEVDDPRALLLLGHGSGGGLTAPDLVLATEVANAASISVALVEQPYRVAGRRTAPPALTLDEAWLDVVAALRTDSPLICGGRSAGARVACRTAEAAGAAAVLCLAFPLHPPGKPERSRLAELDSVSVPVLVIQGRSDPFGMPPRAPDRGVVQVAGNHSLKADRPAQTEALERWFTTVVAARAL